MIRLSSLSLSLAEGELVGSARQSQGEEWRSALRAVYLAKFSHETRLPALADELRIGPIVPQPFLRPRVRQHRSGEPAADFFDWRASHSEIQHIAILGGRGSGKSTLARVYCKWALDQRYSSCLPILCSASSLQNLVQSLVTVTLDNLLSLVDLSTHGAHTSPLNAVLLIDRVDELPIEILTSFLDSLGRIVSIASIVILCRDDYFMRYLRHTAGSSRFTPIDLLEWSPNEIGEYASQFCSQSGRFDVWQRFQECLTSWPITQDLCRVPLHVSILLWIFHVTQDALRIRPNSVLNLLETFYQEWFAWELRRGLKPEIAPLMTIAHELIAIELYNNWRHPVELESEILGCSITELDTLLEQPAFTEIMRFRRNYINGTYELLGFTHDALLEYLVARNILRALLAGGSDLERVLSTMYRYDVNSLVREGLAATEVRQCSRIEQNLTEAYLRTTLMQLTDAAVRLREQILYYLGRLPSLGASLLLRQAFKEEPLEMQRRMAAISAILRGDTVIERAYVSSLRPGTPADLAARSSQLVYFGDVSEDIHIFSDDGSVSWELTKKALFQRVQEPTPRARRLRLLDLTMLNLFFCSRPSQTFAQCDYKAETTWAGITRSKEKQLKKAAANLERFRCP